MYAVLGKANWSISAKSATNIIRIDQAIIVVREGILFNLRNPFFVKNSIGFIFFNDFQDMVRNKPNGSYNSDIIKELSRPTLKSIILLTINNDIEKPS